MATCANCSTFIVFGGKRSGNSLYCSDRCLQAGQLAEASLQVDPAVVQKEVETIFSGPCPNCHKQNGPVDIRKSHNVFSALILTRWKTNVIVGCKSCGTKRQVGDLLLSGVAGWWGFPWGLIMTPVQIVRNANEMLSANVKTPSPDLQRLVRLQLGARLQQANPTLADYAPKR